MFCAILTSLRDFGELSLKIMCHMVLSDIKSLTEMVITLTQVVGGVYGKPAAIGLSLEENPLMREKCSKSAE